MTTNNEQKTKKRTAPRLEKHRRAINLAKTENQTDKLIKKGVNAWIRKLKAEENWERFIRERIIQDIIYKANEKLDEDDRTDTLTIYNRTGDYCIRVSRTVRRFFDHRAIQAKSLITEFMREVESQVDPDPDTKMMFRFLNSLFESRQGDIKWTPQLQDFMTMKSEDIRDKRLRKAQELLIESVRIDRSKWNAKVLIYDEDQHEYRTMEFEDIEV